MYTDDEDESSRVSVDQDKTTPDKSESPSDPLLDEVHWKQTKVLSFADQLETYAKWATAEESIICQMIGGYHCTHFKSLPPLLVVEHGVQDVLTPPTTEFSLSGKEEFGMYTNKIRDMALYRYVHLVTLGHTDLCQVVMEVTKEIELWNLCPLADFRDEASREAERVECARAKEAERLNVSMSQIPRGKPDYLEDFISTRLFKIAKVMDMVKDVCVASLKSSQDAWEDLVSRTAHSGHGSLHQKSVAQTLNDLLSTNQHRQDRVLTEQSVRRLHYHILSDLLPVYQSKREGLELLASEVNEWRERWSADQRDSTPETPEKTRKDLSRSKASRSSSGKGTTKGRGKAKGHRSIQPVPSESMIEYSDSDEAIPQTSTSKQLSKKYTGGSKYGHPLPNDRGLVGSEQLTFGQRKAVNKSIRPKIDPPAPKRTKINHNSDSISTMNNALFPTISRNSKKSSDSKTGPSFGRRDAIGKMVNSHGSMSVSPTKSAVPKTADTTEYSATSDSEEMERMVDEMMKKYGAKKMK